MAKLDDDCHAYLTALFWCSQFEQPKSVNFLIDSGCTTTTILNDDAAFLGIDCSALHSSCAVTTANGSVRPYQLPEAILIFTVKKGFLNMAEGYWGTKLLDIHCYAPTNPLLVSQYNQYQKENSFSLLGMDFLKKFRTLKFKYKEKQLFLIP